MNGNGNLKLNEHNHEHTSVLIEFEMRFFSSKKFLSWKFHLHFSRFLNLIYTKSNQSNPITFLSRFSPSFYLFFTRICFSFSEIHFITVNYYERVQRSIQTPYRIFLFFAKLIVFLFYLRNSNNFCWLTCYFKI